MSSPVLGRPCRYCVAEYAGHAERVGGTAIVPDASDCEWRHRDDQRVYDLARAIASVCQQRNPTDEQISWFLEDADEVVDDFKPVPEQWQVRRLPLGKTDGEHQIEMRLRINNVTYVGLEGGKDSRGSLLRLSELRAQERQAAEEYRDRQAITSA